MASVEQIKKLLDRGDYVEAGKQANELEVSSYQKLHEVTEIVEAIKHHEEIVAALESRIKNYDLELRNVKDTAFQMEEKEHAVQVQCKNLTDTCDILQDLIENLTIDDQVQSCLLDGNLYDELAVGQIESALNQFEKTLKYKPDPVLLGMRCVRDQKEHAANIRYKFSERFYNDFVKLVQALLNEYSESFINTIYSSSITMPEHDVIHGQLSYLAPIIRWFSRNDSSVHEALNNFYMDRSKNQYDKELKVFFECARDKMFSLPKHGRLTELSAEMRKRTTLSSTGDASTRASSLSGNGTLDTPDTASAKGSDISYTGWEEFDAYVEEILRALDPACVAEQQFYQNFFSPADSTNSEQDSHVDLINRQLADMFSGLKVEFIDFANYYNSLNGLYSLYLLVRLSQYLSMRDESNLFLTHIYREVRVIVKRNFDSFMEQQLLTIREFKVPKQAKCGFLSVVRGFEQFAKQVETLFKSIDSRRSDIDRWYPELVTELFKTIDRMEHSRTPTEMIRLENYNYLHDVLRSIKVSCLDAQRKEANFQYKASLNAYVARYFGRPLEKVSIFFEGVQLKVSQGVKEEEISFQLAFSKQELRKVLSLVSLKEVRKGLEEMYRRIEKHASEPDSNLIQVIWHAMQEEFLSQYKAIQGMIERCYPSTNLGLTFTIDDVLQVFSDIAQSH